MKNNGPAVPAQQGAAPLQEESTMRFTRTLLLLTAFVLSLFVPCFAQSGPPADFQPDPKSVRRAGPAYRYPQAGWIVLHIQGKPYERGFQHGHLLAAEDLTYLLRAAAAQDAHDPRPRS